MLTEINKLQSSDESVRHIEVSFDIETRSEEDGELVHKKYTFSYAKEWDEWNFMEYEETRTPDEDMITDRNWRRSRHVLWNESEVRTVEVPPEVTEALAEATGSSVKLCSP